MYCSLIWESLVRWRRPNFRWRGAGSPPMYAMELLAGTQESAGERRLPLRRPPRMPIRSFHCEAEEGVAAASSFVLEILDRKLVISHAAFKPGLELRELEDGTAASEMIAGDGWVVRSRNALHYVSTFAVYAGEYM